MSKQTKRSVDAVYGNGLLRLPYTDNPSLTEGEHVRLIVEPVDSPESGVELLTHLYDGLSEEDIDDIERIILDKRDFFSGKPVS